MKVLLMIMSLFFFTGIISAQTIAFSEDFETLPLAFDTSGTANWDRSSVLQSTGQYSDSARIVNSYDTAIITSTVFSTLGKAYVYLEFDQICKIAFTSHGLVQVSGDSGTTWTTLTSIEYSGSGQFGTLGNRFTAASYLDWVPSVDSVIPNNTWWKQERFDLSNLVADTSNVMIRFLLRDAFGSGGFGNYGWLVDNIKITTSNDELDPPIISFFEPFVKDSVYSTGPFEILAEMLDSTGIDTAYVVYTHNGITDTIGMEIQDNSTVNHQFRKGVIPSLPYGSIFCYYIEVIDGSNSSNTARLPKLNCQNVYAVRPFDEITIGIGGSEGHMAPMFNDSVDGLNKYSQHIGLYTANELKYKKSDFVKIAWKKTNFSSYLDTTAQLKIYFKHTLADTVNVTAGSYATSKAGATLVYDASNVSLPQLKNWNEFKFNVDTFNYDGTSNVLVFVEWYRPGSLTLNFIDWQYSNVTNRAVSFAGSTPNPTGVYGIDQLPNAILYTHAEIFDYDIGVSKVENPHVLVIGNNAQDIKLRVSNFGSETINKFDLHYTVDGGSTTIYPWTGNLDQDITSSDIVVGSQAFISGSHNITSWTNLPNDSNDMYKYNDTLSFDFFVCTEKLNGSYTIGGIGADFQSFYEVEERLNYCGIDGPVTFFINTGTYSENISINKVEGASSVNTVTFTSVTSNPSDVILSWNAPSEDKDYIFKLNKSEWIRIKNITLKSTNLYNSTSILLSDSSKNNIIENCKISSGPISNTYSYGIRISGYAINNNLYVNNKIKNVSYGFSLNSSGGNSTGNVIKNNIISNYLRDGIYLRDQDSIVVYGNEIETNDKPYLNGINVYSGGYKMSIVNNKIDINSTYGAKGIVLYNATSSAIVPGLIANNFVSIRGAAVINSARSAMQLDNSSNFNIIHNSFALYSVGSNSKTIYVGINNSSIKMANNIFSNFSGGKCYETSTNAVTNSSITYSDYNCFYSSGSIYGKWGYTNTLVTSQGISSLTSLSHMDSNSVFTDPLFYTQTNLHSFSIAINEAGIGGFGVTTDIDGEQRNLTTPDIGADEFHLSDKDIGIIDLIKPIPLDTQLSSVSPLVVVKNFGTDTVTSFIIKYELDGGSTQSYNYIGSIAYSKTDTVSLTAVTIPVLDYSLKVYTELVGDTITSNDSLEFSLFGLPLVELEAIELVGPIDACDMDTNEVVKIKIKNNGVNDVSSGVTVSYQIVGSSTIVSETLTSPLIAGIDFVYTFNTKADLSVLSDSLFKLKFFVSHLSDPVSINDTAFGDVLSLGILSAPIVFDTTINYGTSVTLNAISPYNVYWYESDSSMDVIAEGNSFTTPQLFDTTTYYAESNTNVPALTRVLGTNTTTNDAGADECVYYGAGYKHQILIRASELTNMGIHPGEITSLSFYIESTSYYTNHSQFTIKMGNTDVDALTTSFITSGLTQVYQHSFQEALGWNLHQFSTPFTWDGVSNVVLDFLLFTNYGDPKLRYSSTSFASVAYIPTYGGTPGTSIKRPNMRFTTNPVLGCAGIRTAVDVNVPLAAIEANMSAILSPSQSCDLDTTTIECQIVNMGTDTIPAGYNVSYSIDTNAFITPEIVNISIAPGDTLNYTFNTFANFPSGPIGNNYDITAAISVPNDFFNSNDTVILSNFWSEYSPAPPVIASTPSIDYADSVSLNASAADTIYWYYDDIANNYIGDGISVKIGPLYDTTIVYARAVKTIPLTNFNIGTGTTYNPTTSGPSPFGGGSYQAWGLRNQYLITAGEMRSIGMLKGEINSLAFNIKTVAGNSHKNFSIKIGTTDQNELNSFENNLSEIYSHINYGDVLGWNTFNLSTPFYWDGESNVVIETCFKNTAWITSGYSSSYNTNTDFVSSITTFGASSFSCTDTVVKSLHYKRPNIRFNAKGYGNCPSNFVMHQIDVQGAPSIDIGVVSIETPQGTISSSIAEDINVVIKNYGIDTINNATINYMDRDMVINSYSWTGQLFPGQLDTVLIANHLFMGGQTKLLSWTSMPNNIIDTIPNNDTASVNLDICMQGVYTIGANMNYINLQDAFDDMLISTVCGPVVLDIDTGVYQQQYVLPAISGVSETNNITIKSIANDSSTVHLIFGTVPSNNYVLKLDNSPYVTIKSISFNANGNNTSNCIALSGNTHDVDIRNCVLNSSSSVGLGADASGVYSEDGDVGYITIENNIVNGGYNSIYFEGSFSNNQKGITIKNNNLQGFYYSGVYARYQDSTVIDGNNIVSGVTGSTVYGIYQRSTNNTLEIKNNRVIVSAVLKGFGIYSFINKLSVANRGVISNNMLTIKNANDESYGFYVGDNINVDFVYNSINLLNGNSTNAGAIFMNGSENKLINNSIYSQKGRILDVVNPSSLSQCDFNNYYTDTVNNQYFVKWINDVSDLSALKAIDLSSNVNSISVNPSFYSDDDLHTYEVLLNGAATPLSNVTIDFDGEIRDINNPDIGADEFTLYPIDLGVVGMIHPNAGGCNYTSNDSIVVQIRNFGTSVIDFSTQPAIVTVYSNGINPDTITYTLNSGSVATGQLMDVKVTNNFNLNMIGLYEFDARIDMPNDGNPWNDDMNTQEFSYFQSISNFPFIEDFESGASNYFGNAEGPEISMGISSNNSSLGSSSMRFSGGDKSGFTPTTTVEQAFSHISNVGTLYSCEIDATGLNFLNLRFDLMQTYYSSVNSSWFRVLVQDQNGLHYLKNALGDSTFRPSTMTQDPFTSHTFSLNAYVGQVISLYFEAALGSYTHPNGFGDNAYLDNIYLWSPVNIDISMNSIPNLGIGYMKTGDTYNPQISVENFGTATINTLPVSYSINGQAPIMDTLSVSIGSLQTDTVSLNALLTVLNGNQELCIVSHLPGDSVYSNDTVCAPLQGVNVKGLDYIDDFEGVNEWFVNGTNLQWEKGLPNSTNFTSAHSGVNAYVTNLTGDYSTNSKEYLYSPYITIPAVTDTVVLEFAHMMQMVSQFAFGYVEYSFNGQLWLSLGYIGDQLATNWYTTNINGKHTWSNSSNNWIYSSIKLDPTQFNTGADVQFRFVFQTLASSQTKDGWMIDDFAVKIPKQQIDVGVTQIIEPDTLTTINVASNVIIEIKNYGYDTLSNIPVSFKAGSLAEINEMWSGTLYPDSTVIYTFTNDYISPTEDYTLCAKTKLSGDVATGNDEICKQLQVKAPEWDAEVIDVNETYSSDGNIIKIIVTNNGQNTITSLSIQYTYASFQSNIEQLPSPLNYGDTVVYSFTQHAPSVTGSVYLCGVSMLPNDMVPSNDQVCKLATVTSLISNEGYMLNQNMPNPFDNSTTISYTVAKTCDVRFRVINLLGEVVFEEEHKNVVHKYSKNYDFSFLNPGIYYYSILIDGRVLTKKMIVN